MPARAAVALDLVLGNGVWARVYRGVLLEPDTLTGAIFFSNDSVYGYTVWLARVAR